MHRWTILLALLAACAPARSSGPAQTAAPAPAPSMQPVTLELYVMSQCPYGVQAESALAPALRELGDAVDFRLNYIGDFRDGEPTSLHGAAEVQGDVVQLCARAHAPQHFMEFLDCQNNNVRHVDSNWRACAWASGIDASSLEACLRGPEGRQLLKASFAYSRLHGASGSPTIIINRERYNGRRGSMDFLRALCGAFTGEKPERCRSVPPPPVVHALFFSDARCRSCDLTDFERRLAMQVPGLVADEVDYMTDRGKALYRELRALDDSFRLPAVLFDESLKADDEDYAAFSRWLRPIGDYLLLSIRADFDPTAEICDNGVDDDGNGDIDCRDSACAGAIACREEKPERLDLFVMSQCPYGAKAVLALDEIMKSSPLEIGVHFIGAEVDGQLTSLHGEAEIEEDMRQACVVEAYGRGAAFMKYLACRATDYRNPDWRACTGGNGIDADSVERCAHSEGVQLLRADFALAESLGITASPTFLVNNRHLFHGIDVETILANTCRYNPTLAGCGGAARPGATPATQPDPGSCN